jgi:DNA-binding response OmpR family regulator
MSEGGPAASSARFDGLKILVVEDETMVSFLIEDTLIDLGCAEVWHAASVPAALDVLHQRRPDAAVLDVNLRGELAYPVAEQLEAANVPFVFATGYGQSGLSGHWAARPVLQKPFQAEVLAAALEAVLSRDPRIERSGSQAAPSRSPRQ